MTAEISELDLLKNQVRMLEDHCNTVFEELDKPCAWAKEDEASSFKDYCEAFYHLAGGLLKLHNGSLKNTAALDEAGKLALDVHKKICDDFLGGKDA